jgi:1,2-diacylglycerol 3-beta-glucosyltransferase
MPPLVDLGIAAALWVLLGSLGLLSLYIVFITLGAWCLRAPVDKPRSSLRVAILVPAHNEEHGIGTTIRDLLAADYARSGLEIFVIADNCSDGTAAAARAAGASVLERFDTTSRGKGQALDWALKKLDPQLHQFDLVAFVDADMYVDRRFLAAMASAFEDARVQVVQGRYTISNPSASWLTALGFMSFAYVNHVRPAGRAFWGGTAELKGSGMVFRRELICSTGWPAGSIAEDVDFGKELLLRGIAVQYHPHAIVTSDIPSKLKQVAVQQSRWEGGKFHVFRKFSGPTARQFLKTPKWALADALFDLCVPPLALICFFAVVGFAAAWFVDGPPAWAFLLPLAAFGCAVSTGLAQLRPPAKTYLYVAFAPFFLAWKLIMLARIALKPAETEWKRTPRDAEQNPK